MSRAVLALTTALLGCTMAGAAERSAWQQDFEALADQMAVAHANLEWIRDHRGVDVAALYREAHARLGEAGSRREARRIVTQFIEAFGDPHLHLTKGDDRGSRGGDASDDGVAPSTPTDDALDAMGFDSRDLDFRIAFDRLPDFERVTPSPDNPFAWGVFTVGGSTVGVLRIAQFGDQRYPEVAAAQWPAFAASLDGPCDQECQWRFRGVVMNALLEHLAAGARAFAARNVAAVLIDITGNGGGSDWAAVAPRIFAPPLPDCPPLGLVRHPHHAVRVAQERAAMEQVVREQPMSATSQQIMSRAVDSLAALAARLDEPCDRRDLFRSDSATLSCTQLAYSPGCGVLEYLPPGSLDDVPQRAEIFSPLDQRFEEGVWHGPLFVLMDRRTASASEHFVSLLQANRAATFLGERTMGAGCGFIAGGIPLYLEHLDVTAWMPDCARFRADGHNELEGFEPDLPIDWSGGNGTKAHRVHEALARLLSRNADALADRSPRPPPPKRARE